MPDDDFLVRFWGTRGSIPVSGPDHQEFGGNTSCVELMCGSNRLLFDAGSGLRQAGEALLREGLTGCDLFFTHCHYDHIIGLPFFRPLYLAGISVTVWSGHLAGRMTTEAIVEEFLKPPWLPSEVDRCRAHLDYRDFKAGDVLSPCADVKIATAPLNHSGGCIGYRVEWSGRIVAIVFDFEHRGEVLDTHALRLMQDADLAIYDSTYTEEEMPRYSGFGHSTAQQGIRLAKAAGTRRLALFHHSPSRTDRQLQAIESAAQAEMPGAFAARDGQVVEVTRAKHGFDDR